MQPLTSSLLSSQKDNLTPPSPSQTDKPSQLSPSQTDNPSPLSPSQTDDPSQPSHSQTKEPSPPPEVERYVRADGKIGVIISPGHGGAWSAQDRDLNDPEMTVEQRLKREEIALFDKNVVAAVLAGKVALAKELFKAKVESLGDFCTDGMDLRVEWVNPGEEFEVAEYDGMESIRLRSRVHFWRA